MPIQEIYHPVLELHVKFKLKGPDDQEFFRLAHSDLPPDAFRQEVLESVIYNFKTDIVPQMRSLPKETGILLLNSLYNQCVQMQPGLDPDLWQALSRLDPADAPSPESITSTRKTSKSRSLKAKHLNLERYLDEQVIGQPEAVAAVSSALKRSFAGLGDPERPMGVFLFAGSSGVGKTLLAKKLHEYLFDGQTEVIRVDCGEYQQKHENQKLIGSPPGYHGHEEGGQLTNQIINNPNTVVLLDEVEKAHPDVMNTFLRVFDEGILTDAQGRRASFRNAVIIMTTNLGNNEVVNELTGRNVGFGKTLFTGIAASRMPSRDRVEQLADEEIRKHFSPEMVNRIDQVVVFNHLNERSYSTIAEVQLQLVSDKLAKQGYKFAWDDQVVEHMVSKGTNPVNGARGLEHIRRQEIEDMLAQMLIERTYTKGSTFVVCVDDTQLKIETIRKRASPKKVSEV